MKAKTKTLILRKDLAKYHINKGKFVCDCGKVAHWMYCFSYADEPICEDCRAKYNLRIDGEVRVKYKGEDNIYPDSGYYAGYVYKIKKGLF